MPQNKDRHREYMREWARQQAEKKKQEWEKALDPLDLNAGMRPKPMEFEEWSQEPENKGLGNKEWLDYKLHFERAPKSKRYEPRAKDLREMAEYRKQKLKEEAERYGTSDPDCIEWRKNYEKGNTGINHIQICMLCSGWAKNAKDKFDLNATKGNTAKELRGYVEVFRGTEDQNQGMGFNQQGMQSICPFCGGVLDARGKCDRCGGYQKWM